MMYPGQRKKRKKESNKDNKNSRLNFLAAIIFLFAAMIGIRLVYLQIVHHELYVALASNQHSVQKELEARRGRIFIQEKGRNNEISLYPVATNKDFAFVYAVPKKIENPAFVAEELYRIFDEEKIIIEVEKILKEDPQFSPLFFPVSLGEDEVAINPKEREELQEFYEIKKEAEIKIRKDLAIEAYMRRVDKPGDPYEPIKRKVDEGDLEKVLAIETEGLYYFNEKHRYYPEKNYGSHMLGFVGYSDDREVGRYGLEGFFDHELSGKSGYIKAERAGDGSLVIIKDREYEKAQDGSSIILTIDRAIQYTACKRLGEESRRLAADGGTVIVMEPDTGAILAMCSWPDYDPNNFTDVESLDIYNNPAIFDSYEPGSIFKAFTIAAAIDAGAITPQTTYVDKGFRMIEGWNKPIKNSDYETFGGHGLSDMNDVLELSLNTGTILAMEKMGAENFARYMRRFGFGEKSGIELETEGVSNINNLLRNKIRPIEAATASFGQGITATPLQLTAAYAAIANGGMMVKPHLVAEILNPDNISFKTQPPQLGRVISERSALLASGMLVNVVDHGHAGQASVDGYYLAGKTGTAQVADKGGYGSKTMQSFVGFGPVEDPKFVIFVRFDNSRNTRYAASSATPLFGELAKFILDYYQVEKER